MPTPAPESKLFDPATTALVWIDLQQGIVPIPILAPHSGKDVVKKAAELSAAFRAAGSFVVYVRVDMANALHLPVDRSMRDPTAPPPPAAASELAADCGYQPGDGLVLKRQWGAFLGTDLDQLLRRRGIRTIVLGGIATNIGVESTARSATDLGYAVVFVSDAMTTVSAEMQALAVQHIFPMMGRVRTSAEIMAEVGRQ
jgi:nicotinamidase-related amidase